MLKTKLSLNSFSRPSLVAVGEVQSMLAEGMFRSLLFEPLANPDRVKTNLRYRKEISYGVTLWHESKRALAVAALLCIFFYTYSHTLCICSILMS